MTRERGRLRAIVYGHGHGHVYGSDLAAYSQLMVMPTRSSPMHEGESVPHKPVCCTMGTIFEQTGHVVPLPPMFLHEVPVPAAPLAQNCVSRSQVVSPHAI